jgi:hypothetical protein
MLVYSALSGLLITGSSHLKNLKGHNCAVAWIFKTHALQGYSLKTDISLPFLFKPSYSRNYLNTNVAALGL